jgi:ATP-dependent Clp protease ATP-binding subunit ClpX
MKSKKIITKVCNFCGKPASEVGTLIESNQTKDIVRICQICHSTCSHIFSFHDKKKTNVLFSKQKKKTINPKSIKEFLDDHVIGQDDAKKSLAISVANHYKRIFSQPITNKDLFKDVQIEKSNVLFVGPTGSGKTLLLKKLAECLEVPLSIGDATSLTEAGYVGDDVESLIASLLRSCDYDIEAAQSGIIYIDEIDKIATSKNNVSISRDVGGEGVQQALLKIIEGTTCSVPPQGGRKHPEQKLLHINTTNILFVVGGTFVGLDDIIAKRNGRKMGFGISEEKTNSNEILPEDLVKFGLIPEFVGRFPIIQKLQKLNVGDIVRIIKEPKNSILKQYQKMFMYDAVELNFSENAISLIAEKALELDTGARSIKQIFERVLFDYSFNIVNYSNKTINIDESYVRSKIA